MKDVTITVSNEEQEALGKELDKVRRRLNDHIAGATAWADDEAHAALRPLNALIRQLVVKGGAIRT